MRAISSAQGCDMRLGIDLGGTKIEIIAIERDGSELLRHRAPTPHGDYDATIRAIRDLVVETESKLGERGSLGVAIPGTISRKTGLVKNANSTALIGHSLDKDLQAALSRDVRVANDANCFTLSESVDGAGAGCDVVFGVILGTGVGGGVCVGGRVLDGPHGIAGEWGHNPLPAPRADEKSGFDCYCGKEGCIESWISGPALSAQYRRRTGRDMIATDIAAATDADARAVTEDFLDRLARSLASIVNVLDPDAIVIGGGLSKIDAIYREMPSRIEAYAFNPESPTPVLKNMHGDSSGVRGAAWLWPPASMSSFCRDCLADAHMPRCKACGSRRIVSHDELDQLTIAHIDCDAFYAAIEKRDNPDLIDKPVIVGGGKRGVVSTCCYMARIYGVKSAMPMFLALKACPQAIVIRPNMAKYAGVARQVRAMMRDLTPQVEPLSLDEAYLDLSGTERLHGTSPAKTMAGLAKRIHEKIGITASIGLSYNKFLAKLASELDKPRGFAVIGRAEAKSFLRDKPVGFIRGAGAALQAKLTKDGITRIAQLQDADVRTLARAYGNTGLWLHRLANAEDSRKVDPDGELKSISSETTFFNDIAAYDELEDILWEQAERVSARAKASELGGRTVVLKLKTANFKIRTRSASLDAPTQLADRIFRVSREALRKECDGTAFRLLGVGISNICAGDLCDPADLVDQDAAKRAAAERAMDRVRAKFGRESMGKGRALK